jgi:hypothetical protein
LTRDRRALVNALLTVASLAVGLAAVEAGLRLFAPQPLLESYRVADAGGPITRRDPEIGWTLKPDVAGLAGSEPWEAGLSTNADGFRDAPHAPVKAPGAYRVAVLGDSFVFGSGVPQESILTRRLAAHLGTGFEIVNLGVPGYGTDQELLTLRRWGKKLAPDLVLAGFFWNDVMENSSARIYGMAKPRFTLEDGALVFHPPAGASAPSAFARLDAALLETSHLWSLVRNGLSGAGRTMREASEERPVSIDLSLRNPPARREREFALTFALLGAIGKEAAALGAPLVVFSVPPRFLVEDAVAARLLRIYGLPPDALEQDGFRRVREACAGFGVGFVDLLPGFRREGAAGARLFLPTGIHWSAAGHEAAARILEPAVRGDLPQVSARSPRSPVPAAPTAAASPGSAASAP